MEEEEEWEEERLSRVAEEEVDEAVMVHCDSPRVPRLPSSSPPKFSNADSIIIFGDQDSDEEDEIKDYIGDVEADSAASESPASQGREDRRREAGEACCDSDQEEELAAGLGKTRVTAEDTISDESGYSEEPTNLGKEVTVVKVNLARETGLDGEMEFEGDQVGEVGGQHKLEIRLQGGEEQQVTITGRNGVRWSQPLNVDTSALYTDPASREVSPSPFSVSPDCEHPPSPRTLSPIPIPPSPTVSQNSPSPSPRELVSTSPRVSDLSVKSVLLSEFSSSDKIRYIERTSGMKASKSAMVLNRQEFCINI